MSAAGCPQRARELSSLAGPGMTRRSNRSPDRAPRGRCAPPARAASIATPRQLKSFACATTMRALKLAGRKGRSSSASRTLASPLKRVKMRESDPAGRSISGLPISARTASSSPLSTSAAIGPGGRLGRRASAVWATTCPFLRAIDKVGARSERASAEAPRRRRQARPPPARGSTDAALRWSGTGLPPALGAREPKDRRPAPSSPAQPRRARRRQFGVEIGARERARRFRARLRVGGLRPGKKSAHNVRPWRKRAAAEARSSVGWRSWVALPRPSWRRTFVAQIAPAWLTAT